LKRDLFTGFSTETVEKLSKACPQKEEREGGEKAYKNATVEAGRDGRRALI
jgi:hypothetical protein